MKVNLSASQFAVVAFVAVMGYLYMTESLTSELFFVFAILIIMTLIYSSREKRVITLDEANKIAETHILKLQRKGEVPDGNVRVAESELKDIILRTPKSPMVEPDRFLVVVSVEPMNAYLVKVSIYGTVLGYSKIPLSAMFSVTDIKDREVRAGITRMDDYKKGDEERDEGNV